MPWPIFATSKFWQSNKYVNPDHVVSEGNSTKLIALINTGCYHLSCIDKVGTKFAICC